MYPPQQIKLHKNYLQLLLPHLEKISQKSLSNEEGEKQIFHTSEVFQT